MHVGFIVNEHFKFFVQPRRWKLPSNSILGAAFGSRIYEQFKIYEIQGKNETTANSTRTAVTDPLKDFRRYRGITEAWELIKTGLLVISGDTYKLEVWYSHSNADLPYYVAVYVQQDGIWKRMPDAPLPVAPDPDVALSTAMALLNERAAA